MRKRVALSRKQSGPSLDSEGFEKGADGVYMGLSGSESGKRGLMGTLSMLFLCWSTLESEH